MPSDLVIPKVMDIDERLWAKNLPGSSSFLANTADQSQAPQAPCHLLTSPLQHLARLLREYPAR